MKHPRINAIVTKRGEIRDHAMHRLCCELEHENAAMKAAIRALAARDFGLHGWDAECESAALRLRAFLLPNKEIA